jgi:hypothetical protein
MVMTIACLVFTVCLGLTMIASGVMSSVFGGVMSSKGVVILYLGLMSSAIVTIATVYLLAVHRTTAEIDKDQILIRHGPLPLPGRTIPVGIVEQFYCNRHYRRDDTVSFISYYVRVVTQKGRRITLLSGFASVEDAEFVERTIEDFLGIADQDVDLSLLDRYRSGGWVRLVGSYLLGFALLGGVVGVGEAIRSSIQWRRQLHLHSGSKIRR